MQVQVKKITVVAGFLVFLPGMALGFHDDDSSRVLNLRAGVDLVSRYVWRGSDLGNSPSVQPCLELSLSAKKHSLTLGVFGALPVFPHIGNETDLYLTYTFLDRFSLTLTDYYAPEDPMPAGRYFEYREPATDHIFEGILTVEGPDEFPVYALAGWNFYGADPDRSIYLETGFSVGYFDCFLGLTPRTGMYHTGEGKGLSVVNTGVTFTYPFNISKEYGLAVYTSLIVNPQAGKVFFVAGVSL